MEEASPVDKWFKSVSLHSFKAINFQFSVTSLLCLAFTFHFVAWKEPQAWRFSGESVWLHIAQKAAAGSFFSTDKCLTKGFHCSTLSRFFVNRSTLCLLYFMQQSWNTCYLYKVYRVVCTQFPFLLTIWKIATHYRSSSSRFWAQWCCLQTVFNIASVLVVFAFCFFANEAVIPVNIDCTSLEIAFHCHSFSTCINTDLFKNKTTF